MKLGEANLLLCVYSCQKYTARQRSIMDTWGRTLDLDHSGAAVLPSGKRFQLVIVEGGHPSPSVIARGRMLLDCDDSYPLLTDKTLEMLRAAVQHVDFDYLIKSDDDTYIHLERLFALEISGVDYLGKSSSELPRANRFAQGGLYVLSRKAVLAAANGIASLGSAEDEALGATLAAAGIPFFETPNINPHKLPTPFQDSSLASCHWVTPTRMYRIHRSQLRPPAVNRLVWRCETTLQQTISFISKWRRRLLPSFSLSAMRKFLRNRLSSGFR